MLISASADTSDRIYSHPASTTVHAHRLNKRVSWPTNVNKRRCEDTTEKLRKPVYSYVLLFVVNASPISVLSSSFLPPSGQLVITLRVRRSRREMYIGHGRLCACVPACLFVAAFSHYCTDPDVTWGMVGGSFQLCTIRRICNRCVHFDNFISSPSDRKRRKKVKQLYNTTKRNEKHRQIFVHIA